MQEIVPSRLSRILVPLDGSNLSESALQPAIDLAQANRAGLILLHVTYFRDVFLDLGGAYSYPLWEGTVELNQQNAVNYLEMVEKTMLPAGLAPRKLVLDGDEAGTIVDTAQAEGVDLIVMSTHGRSGLERWLLGSVTDKVLRASPCPVLVIPPSGRAAAHLPSMPQQPELEETELLQHRTISRVLIPLDGSPLAEQCLAAGLGVVCAFGAELFLLRVVEKPGNIDMVFAKELDSWEEGLGRQYRQALSYEAEKYLGEVTGRLPDTGKKVHTMVREGAVASKIIDTAAAEDIDLIVMTTHGRTGLRRWAYGSVTGKVLSGAPCAVMIIRPHAHQLN